MTSSPRSGVAVSNNRIVRTGILCLLYFAQGFPWGFATIALLAALSEAGHSKEKTAGLVALAILPWTFKLAWAPLIDTLRLPAMGLRRPWIIVAQGGMAITLFGVWGSGSLDEVATLSFLAWVFFAHNCFASLQDVATDALAVDLLDDSERGRVNGLMWGSKLFGISVGGAGMGAVIAASGMATAVLIQAIGIVAILALVIFIRERPGEKRLPWSAGSTQAPVGRIEGGPVGVVRELLRALSLRTTFLAMFVALTVNLCEGLYVPLTTELFVQKFKWTAAEFAKAQGTWGTVGEVIGALVGGVLCDRFGRRRMAGVGMILTSTTLFLFAGTSRYWFDEAYPQILLLPLFKGFMALTTVSLFSLYMKISWTGAAATQFTMYMTLTNVGYMAGAKLNSLNSWIEEAVKAEWLSIEQFVLTDAHFYMLGASLVLVPLAFLVWLRPETVVARKIAEASQPPETPLSSSSPEG